MRGGSGVLEVVFFFFKQKTAYEMTAIEQVGTLRRCPECREYRADEHGILCVCSGLCCERCGARKIHRPTANFYDERDGGIWHVPYFHRPRLCPECARRAVKSDEPMQTMTPGEQRVLETIARSRGWDFVNAN